MSSLLVVLIILGCAAYQYRKGTLVKSFAVVITSICAGVVAFGYFELLANVFISREILAPWAHPLSFVLLFILAFAVLQTIAAQLTRQSIDLGPLPERIGRVVCGIFLGLIVSGLLLIAVAMAPIPAKYPYQRFVNKTSPPRKLKLNADGFAAGWFNILSNGSFSGKRSFTKSHPDFLNQLYLNRLERSGKEKDTTERDKSLEQPSSAPPKEPGTSSRKPGLSNIGKSIVGDQLDEN